MNRIQKVINILRTKLTLINNLSQKTLTNLLNINLRGKRVSPNTFFQKPSIKNCHLFVIKIILSFFILKFNCPIK
jgi:hypothetical protein